MPAYDDAAGVTAEFNRNVLRVLNRELGADFDVGGVRARRAVGRRATSGSRCGCAPQRAMAVHVAELDLTVSSRPASRCAPRSRRSSGPRRVERRCSPRPASRSTRIWTDPDDRFALTLASAV